jgi:hypothetical protein
MCADMLNLSVSLALVGLRCREGCKLGATRADFVATRAGLTEREDGVGRALRSLRLSQPLVRGQLETSQVADVAWRQAMLNGTFDQQADVTRRGLSPEADPV